MQTITVRELRANLKKHIDAGQPVAIGSRYESPKAILLPIPAYNSWDSAERKKALRAAAQRFQKALRELARSG